MGCYDGSIFGFIKLREFCDNAKNLQFWFQLKGNDVTADGNTLKFQEGQVEFEDKVEIDGEEMCVSYLEAVSCS